MIYKQDNYLKNIIDFRMNYPNKEPSNCLQNFKSVLNTGVFNQVLGGLPQFLNENLLDPQRIIKHFFNDPQAPIRIFYYQYLKLCFEMQLPDYQSYIAKFEQILENQSFQLKFPLGKDKEIYNNDLAKKLIRQFISFLDRQSITIQHAINQYPIMDQILTCFIRTLLIENKICQEYDDHIPREKLFEFLASYFCLDIALYENCLKFIDSDVFMYEKDPENIYMIFIDYQKEKQYQVIHQQTDSEISSMYQTDNKGQNQSKRIQNQDQIQGIQAQKNSGIYEFVDYTCVKSKENQRKQHQNKKQDKSTFNASEFYNANNVIWQVPQICEDLLSTIPKYAPHNTFTDDYFTSENVKLRQMSQSLQNAKTRQNSENIYYGKVASTISLYTSTSANISGNRIFGRAISGNQNLDNSINEKGKVNPFNNPKKVTSYAQPINDQYQYNYLKNLSKQFTDSLLLKQIRQPFQTNIKLMKIRARAQRNALFHS